MTTIWPPLDNEQVTWVPSGRKAEYEMGMIWRADEVLEALDAFAARSGRRGEATVLG